MKTQIEEVSKNKVKLTVEVPTAEVEKLLSNTYRRLAGQVKVPGFRPGKAPRAVIDQRLGKDFVRSEALKDILPDFYAEAVRDSDLDVVSPPSIDVTSFEDGTDLTFEATVETRPTAELGDYAGLKVTKPPADATDDEVNEQIDRLQVRFASLEVIERPLASGDFAQIDLTTKRHDETIEQLTGKDLLFEVGAEMVTPELDTELVGKKKGDILKVNCTLSERFGEQAGWQVSMSVLVKETKARKLPALDDEFAKTVSEFDTLDELRTDIRTRLQEMKESQATNRLRENTLEVFVKEGVEIELPEGMVEYEVDGLVTSLAQLLSAQGLSLKAYMDAQELDADALRGQFREQAENNLKARLGLDAVAEKEALTATDEDRAQEVERLAKRTGRPADDVRRSIDDGEAWKSVDGDILRAKALDLLVERADVTVAEEPSAEAPTDPEVGSTG